MKPLVIFDIDKTLLIDDLPFSLYKNRIFKKNIIEFRLLYTLFFLICFHITRWKIRRRFEYWYEAIIDTTCIAQFILSRNIVNQKIYKRVKRYLELGYSVYFVTAAPRSISKKIKILFDVEVIGSNTFNGFIISDLMGKKEAKVYTKLTKNRTIAAIYSDSIADHSKLARYNYLVTGPIINICRNSI
jgi:hypothetical protein